MSTIEKVYDELRDLMQLGERVSNCTNQIERLDKLVERRFDRLESKVEDVLLRTKELEIRQEEMRTSLRNEILAAVRAEVATVQTVVGLLPHLKSQFGAGTDTPTPQLAPHVTVVPEEESDGT